MGFVVHCNRSWLALAVQLLLRCCRASPRPPPDACVACVDATSEQREDPKGTRALGCGRERRWRAAGKRCNAAPSRRGVLAAGIVLLWRPKR